MISFNVRKMRSLAIGAAALACFAASDRLLAATCTAPPCVTYTATGTFSTTIISGTDQFKLAGQKFTILINQVPESLVPFKTGPGYTEYNHLNMTGTVNSGLDPSPIPLSSNAASIELAVTKTNDSFIMFVPVTVLGLQFNITATINGPLGTLKALSIMPFNHAVGLTSTGTKVTYAYTYMGTPTSTTLSIASGSLSTKVSTALPTSGGPTAALQAPTGTPAAVVLPAADAVLVRRQDPVTLLHC